MRDGLILCLLASAGFALGRQTVGGVPPAAVLAGAAICAAFGVADVAAALATRTRLVIAAPAGDKDDDKLNVRVLTYLAELGSDSPRGVETVAATDVDALKDDGLDLISKSSTLKALAGMVRVLTTMTPWAVSVTQTKAGLAASVHRNGRPVASALVSLPDLFPDRGKELADAVAAAVAEPKDGTAEEAPAGRAPTAAPAAAGEDEPAPPEPPFDLARVVAAFVLTTMAAQYEGRGFEALRGVRSWRSIGLQYVAHTDLASNRAAARIALARAVDLAPTNLPAAYALQMSLFRDSEKPAELGQLADWIDRALKKLSRDATETTGFGSATQPAPTEQGSATGTTTAGSTGSTETTTAGPTGSSEPATPEQAADARRRSGLDVHPAIAPLFLRMLYARLCVLANLVSAKPTADPPPTTSPGTPPESQTHAAEKAEVALLPAAQALYANLDQRDVHIFGSDSDPAVTLRERIRPEAAAVLAWAFLRAATEPRAWENLGAWLPGDDAPTASYQLACLYADTDVAALRRIPELEITVDAREDQPDFLMAMRCLRRSRLNRVLLDREERDPSLRRLIGSGKYEKPDGTVAPATAPNGAGGRPPS